MPPPPPTPIWEFSLEWSLEKAALVAQGEGDWFQWVEEKGIPHPRCPPLFPLTRQPAGTANSLLSSTLSARKGTSDWVSRR